MNPNKNRRQNRGLLWLTGGAAAIGVAIGAAGVASAASDTSSTSSSSVASSTASTAAAASTATAPVAAGTPAAAPQVDPASLPNGPGETLLTGDTLTKVTAAATAAEPGATIIRAETDSGGHAYEVHLKKADGTVETLYFTSTFTTDGSDTGFGGGPGGPGGPHGQAPATPAPAASTTTG